MSYTRIEDTTLYGKSCEIANTIYWVAKGWERFDRDSLGLQLLRSVDSIGANLVEGDSRSSATDALRFFGYAIGSSREAQHWIRQACARKLIDDEVGAEWNDQMDQVSRMLSGLIGYRRRQKSNVVCESQAV